MSGAYALLSEIFKVLNASTALKAVATGGIYVQSQKPKGKINPVLLSFIRSSTQSVQVGVLDDAFIEFAARSDNPDGLGTPMASIFSLADPLIDNKFFSTSAYSGRATRRGLPVRGAVYDEIEKDWVLHWRYRIIIKKK